jgi:hypothetical protein
VESAKRANVAFYTIDARGLNGGSGGGALIDGTVANTGGRTSGSRGNTDQSSFGALLNQVADNILRALAIETGRQQIAGFSAAQPPLSARQFAACPESFFHFPLCS